MMHYHRYSKIHVQHEDVIFAVHRGNTDLAPKQYQLFLQESDYAKDSVHILVTSAKKMDWGTHYMPVFEITLRNQSSGSVTVSVNLRNYDNRESLSSLHSAAESISELAGAVKALFALEGMPVGFWAK